MKYRISELLAAKSITTAGTEVLEIKTKRPISRITAIVRLTNNSWTPTGQPVLAMSTIQLVDGSNVLHSMRGCYTQALAWYSSKRQPFNYINYTDNGLAVACAPIYFGRDLWDPELALVPDRFDNLQLKIAHNYALGGAVPNAATLEVWADLFDEVEVNPVGFLSAQSIWSKTLVASTTDYVQLPVDHPIRLVLPAAFSNDEEPDINIDAVKLSEEHDEKTILEMGVLELLQMFEAGYPVFQEYGEGRTLAANNVEFFVTPCKDVQLAAQPSQDLDNYINFPWSGGNGRNIMGSATSTIQIGIVGRCPSGVIPIPMGVLEEIDSWWDVTKLGSARAKMTTGAGDTSALYELLVQQMRRY